MLNRKRSLALMVVGGLMLCAGIVWAEGFGLGETKEQLKLEYEVSATAFEQGHVTATLTVSDQGRLKPVFGVYLVVPNKSGNGFVDLSIPLAMREADGKQLVSVQLTRELAERAEFQFRTRHLDGKTERMTWYLHAIPLAKHIQAHKKK